MWLRYHGLINRVGDLMRKDAGRQAGDNLGYITFMCYREHIIIDADVVSLEETQSSRNIKERCFHPTKSISQHVQPHLQTRFLQ